MNIAHLYIDERTRKERSQSLRDHNRRVGEYTAQALESVGFPSLGMLAGILHESEMLRKGRRFKEEV